ncbi:APC family permease [Adhaeribacter aquaticus]|uniref:APC family permease n=1 Tax=Adhaeribacter aquaticus TaxID=299567 RepID=UPI00040A544B|nr:amino acid permease [Adhaeribacter aquaticus]
MSGFKRELKLFDAVMIVAGTMIGSGIFIVSSDIAREVGSAGYLLLVWLISGFITLVGALSYAELAGMMPKAGGQYVYLREAYNPLVSFLYGWTLFLVIQTGTIAAVGVAFARFTGVLLPNMFNDSAIILDLGFLQISTLQVLAIFTILLLTYLNSRGVRNGKLIQNVFGSTKIIALFALILLGFIIGQHADAISSNFSQMWQPERVLVTEGQVVGSTPLSGINIVVAIGIALIGALFSSDAWNNISFAGDEVVDPTKTLVRSLAIGTGLVTFTYMLVNIVYLLVLPLSEIQTAASDRVAVTAAEAIGGSGATLAIAVLIMISTFGCINGCILAGARVYYAMAKDGLFFPGMRKLNKKGVPGAALWFQGLWASLLCLSGTYGSLLGYVMFAVIFFYILTIIGIYILRKKMPDLPRPYKAIGYPFLPACYILLASAFCLILLIYRPENSWPGFILVLLGIPVFLLFKTKFKISD